MNNSDLTLKARGIARTLTYNEEPQGAAKHMLLEMAHRLDTLDVRVHRKADGHLLVNGIGKSRYMSWDERVLYFLFGVVPRVV